MQPKDLGLKIKTYRITKNLTQQEFADLLFIAPQTVSKWERGMSYPDVFRLKEVCKILGVSIGEMLGEESVESDSEYMIAIDGGGTKTEFALFKNDGTIVATAVLGPSNPNSCGIEKTFSILEEGINSLLSLAKTPRRIFAGIAGSMLGNHRETILNYLKKQYPACKITVDSDIRSIVGLARENDKCIAAIIGTGSVVYGWNGTTFKRVGGWGYLFDDAGSGYDIGREVLLAAYAYADGLAPLSEVVRLTEIKLGGPVTDHTAKLYSEGRAYIASFCPIAFEALAMGDALAEKIISNSATRFAGLINHMYKLGEYGNRVIISGGLAMHSETMNNMILKNLDPEINIEFQTLPPLFGAMRVCAELEYGKLNFDAFKNNFTYSYNKFN